MSKKQLNITIILYLIVISILGITAFFYQNWKIFASSAILFTLLIYYIVLRLKKNHSSH